MTALIDLLHQATVLKKFLDELEKNPKRTLGALAAVFLLTGAGVSATYRPSPTTQRSLSQLPVTPAVKGSDGTYQSLPQPTEAERQLQSTLQSEEQRHKALLNELNSRKDNAPVTEREVRLLNESGQVSY